jgi:hypothetical protein
MTTRTVRLDPDAERVLEEIREATGLTVSQVLKQGLIAARNALHAERSADPYAVYRTIDLGPGGYAAAPSREAKQAIRGVLLQKVRRR